MDPRFRTPGKPGVYPKLPPLELGVRVFSQEQQTLRIRTVSMPRLFGGSACGSVQLHSLQRAWPLNAERTPNFSALEGVFTACRT